MISPDPATAAPLRLRLRLRPRTHALLRLPGRSLWRVVYVSRATQHVGPLELAAIVGVARRRNPGLGLTGLLVHFDGRFMQYLEGPRRAVHGMLGEVRADPRHQGLEVLLDAPAGARLFPGRAMASLEVDAAGWWRLVTADWPTVRARSANGVSGLGALLHAAEPSARGAEPAGGPAACVEAAGIGTGAPAAANAEAAGSSPQALPPVATPPAAGDRAAERRAAWHLLGAVLLLLVLGGLLVHGGWLA